MPEEQHVQLQSFLLGSVASSCSPKLLEALVQGGMIISDETDELGFLAKRYSRSRHDQKHFALTIVTSLGCNFDCPYCFEAKHPSILEHDVKTAILSMVDDKLPQLSSMYVTWFGGEPLVGKRALFALARQFCDRCERVDVSYNSDIVTNGYLLDKATSVELSHLRVSTAQVSLDGPPIVHNRMRPLAGRGKDSFWPIVRNIQDALEYLSISVRMNVDRKNLEHAEELLSILASEGLAGRVEVYLGQIVNVDDGVPSPSASYLPSCLTNPEFALAELKFVELAARYGFSRPSVPSPVAAPCTAVRANELVVGSRGELYKCWDSVGNAREVVGNVRDYQNPNTRLNKWLKYDPFADEECRSCIALPVCMGGCAHHALDTRLYSNRCGTFRHTHLEQVSAFVDAAEKNPVPDVRLTKPVARRMETR